MMPTVVAPPRLHAAPEISAIRRAAILARSAAESLQGEPHPDRPSHWYRSVACRLAAALADPWATRQRLLAASPAVVESSGRWRTLLEMIEADADPATDADRLRLARLLLRSLVWWPGVIGREAESCP